MNEAGTLSVIVSVHPGDLDPRELHVACRSALGSSARDVEIVFVIDGPQPAALDRLLELRREGAAIRIVRLARTLGQAAAVRIGLRHASGKTILTLPGDLRVEPGDFPRLIEGLEGKDLVVAVRRPAPGSAIRRVRSAAYHALAGALFGTTILDLGCGVRLGRREVFEEVPFHGERDRFFPVLARRLGFRVAAVDVRARPERSGHGAFARNEGSGGVLDLLSVFFLTRFARKPLRFFGLIAAPVFGAGSVSFLYLLYIKLVHGQPLANRPLLLLSVLLLVLGAQIFALGLVAEIVVFTHLRDVQEHAVEEIVG